MSLYTVYRTPLFFFITQLSLFDFLSIGNRFYERPSPNGKNTLQVGLFLTWCSMHLDSTRTTRSIEYRDPEEVWKYTGGGKRLPSASIIIYSLLIYISTKMEQSSGLLG